ncbi:hypothetical protein [Cloacibacterium sp.]|jgi:hypothetical protein|uniref:hypothetical protein n=1 Tax=Cloacibacterium sp. TaxID=1913682 RepID=UPI0039E41BCD
MIPEDNLKEQNQKLEQMNYNSSEDIYNQDDKLSLDIDGNIENSNIDDDMEMNLDVPGSELDNSEEKIGSEDEENNYWSLGGENHEDLEQSEDI